MVEPREHIFVCPECGKSLHHACGKANYASNEVHYYHHHEDNRAQNSVEISRNAKGEYSFSVKAYGETVGEAASKTYDGVQATLLNLVELKESGG